MSDFEEAMHHGYSRADFASEMEELEKIYQELGCAQCKYEEYNSRACRGDFSKCPFTKEVET